MLNSKLLYTGMTRKKDHLHILGEKSAFRYACVTEDGRQRTTYLQYKAEKLTDKKNYTPQQPKM
jgi:ATP-dependent exoDNAse (exonuclease V) alpha subunit